MGDLVLKCGNLLQWCSQGAEAMHYLTRFFAESRTNRRTTANNYVAVQFDAEGAHEERACNGLSMSRGNLVIKPTSKDSHYGGAHSSHVKRDTHIAGKGAIQAKHPMHKMAVSRKHKM
jgi:hypothetical protein